ncbi:MAG TPA: succinate dehydrogenase cytochrome b subunit [Chitinophagaceae bacterium]|nr:succinate dehydrogenase cytochrome b subunit [Chitinophagaceae bacterium]MCC6634361.1 succinate dehydrogenase cytochrome b subunit [Chitinophagaceae bacterium]HNE92744.1 succinate dehydrogenase cytochrome b subunit [Chitinophagaceae bacterium]HNJ58456.1 succinate dehydrogenase cytochrome b subunit [Chitinophagaceae bacterium]HNM34102.1 succinate dehydrogenase cytochrome b subunit [Chitinophagaceae bacterium]
MTWKQMFTSSVGKKLTMGFTGIFLILFLIVHVGLNACIWAMDDGKMFNKAAAFMGDNVVPRILEIGLFAGIILHIVQGFMLESFNRKARGKVKYAVDFGNKGSKWYSRSMGLLGTLLLLFLIMHIAHFWVPSRITGLAEVSYDDKIYHNLFAEMKTVFTNQQYGLVIVILYVLGCLSLAYHLAHGFQSAFRTIGVSNKRYNKMITSLGYCFAIIVPLAFALMPISFYLGWV